MRQLLLPDRRGTSIIEFALLAPLLITLLMGLGDVAPSAMVKFKTSNATQSVADLAGQYAALQTSDMANVFAAGADIMAPFSSTGLSMRITNVVSTGFGVAGVYWSCGQGSLPPLAARSLVITLPNNVDISTILSLTAKTYNLVPYSGANTSFIMVESTYTYQAPAGFVLRTPQVMNNVAYALPRVSSYVGFPWDGNPVNLPVLPMLTLFPGSVAVTGGITCNYSYLN